MSEPSSNLDLLRSIFADWDEFRELDRERVLCHGSGRGKTSGAGLPSTGEAQVIHVRDGKVVKLVLYWDRDRAFADLGLAREGDAP